MGNDYSDGIVLIYDEQEKYDQALNFYKKSIEVIESIRSMLQLEEHKSVFLQSKIKSYEALINLLFKIDEKKANKVYDRECLYYVESVKARAFLDSLQIAKINLKSNLSSIIKEQENEISREISNIQSQLLKPNLHDLKRNELFKKLKEEEDTIPYLKPSPLQFAFIFLPAIIRSVKLPLTEKFCAFMNVAKIPVEAILRTSIFIF